jgi:hypothetical protein
MVGAYGAYREENKCMQYLVRKPERKVLQDMCIDDTDLLN